MLHIGLVILKIIGIILLIILAILLILILSVLFSPIKYKGELDFDNKNFKDTKGFIKGHYLFGLVRIKVIFDKEIKYSVKLLFKSISLDKTKNKNRDSESENNIGDFEDEYSNTDDNNIESNKESINKKSINKKSKESIDEKNKESIDESNKESIDKKNIEKPDTSAQDDNHKKRKSIFFSYKKKLLSIINNFNFKFRRICAKLKNASKRKQEYLDFLRDKRSKEAITFVKESIYKLLRNILPRQGKGTINFGFNDPALTGEVLGIICIFKPERLKKLDVIPNFDEMMFNGNISFKGHICVFTTLLLVLKLYRQKRIREFLEFIKK